MGHNLPGQAVDKAGMNKLAPTALAFATLLGLGLTQVPDRSVAASAQEAGQDDTTQDEGLSARVDALEAEVVALKQQVATATALVEESARYLAGAKARSEALLTTFDAVEKAGFTAGINFHSRELLLAGMRAYAADEAKGLPGAKQPEPAAGKR